MRYNKYDGNAAALAKHEDKLDAAAADDEMYERGAAEKSMAEQVTAIAEEFITEGALAKLMQGGEWTGLLLTNIDAATTALEDAMLEMAKLYDKGEKA